MSDETRVYWMSFCDEHQPDSQSFLGVSVVRVTQADVNDIMPDLVLRFPNHEPIDGPWLAAASRKAHRLGINPGGQLATWRIDNLGVMPENLPIDAALTHEQLIEQDCVNMRGKKMRLAKAPEGHPMSQQRNALIRDQKISRHGYADLEECHRMIRRLRFIYEPEWSLTPLHLDGVWRIRYTRRPSSTPHS